ncbi:MAG: GMP synthase (glutamine-hydrolyzing), partial [Planctomycetota bacterium]
MREEVIVLDFGSQYNQLIARRVRQLGVYAEILPNNTPWEEIEERDPAALILSGGPASVDAEDAATVDERILDCGIPALGICYGMQLIIHMLGGSVQGTDRREYGPARLKVEEPDTLLQ